MLGAVAKRYAEALFQVALERGRMQEIDAQARTLEPLFDDRALKDFFTSPRIPAAQKKRVLEDRLSGRVDEALLNLVKLLIDKGRIAYLPQVMRYFDVLTDERLGVEDATIVSAVPLTQEQLQAVVHQAKRFSSYNELRVKTEVDAGVLGSVKVKLGDHLVLDGTLSSRLQEFRKRLLVYQHRGTGA
jgi:F-type H+-transporting ATPase subunit delta